MWKHTGQIAGSVDSVVKDLPMVIQNFTLVNMTGGAVVCNVYLIKNSRTVSISPYGGTINANGTYIDEVPRLLDSGEIVRLATSGNVSYLFNIENIVAP